MINDNLKTHHNLFRQAMEIANELKEKSKAMAAAKAEAEAARLAIENSTTAVTLQSTTASAVTIQTAAAVSPTIRLTDSVKLAKAELAATAMLVEKSCATTTQQTNQQNSQQTLNTNTDDTRSLLVTASSSSVTKSEAAATICRKVSLTSILDMNKKQSVPQSTTTNNHPPTASSSNNGLLLPTANVTSTAPPININSSSFPTPSVSSIQQRAKTSNNSGAANGHHFKPVTSSTSINTGSQQFRTNSDAVPSIAVVQKIGVNSTTEKKTPPPTLRKPGKTSSSASKFR